MSKGSSTSAEGTDKPETLKIRNSYASADLVNADGTTKALASWLKLAGTVVNSNISRHVAIAVDPRT